MSCHNGWFVNTQDLFQNWKECVKDDLLKDDIQQTTARKSMWEVSMSRIDSTSKQHSIESSESFSHTKYRDDRKSILIQMTKSHVHGH